MKTHRKHTMLVRTTLVPQSTNCVFKRISIRCEHNIWHFVLYSYVFPCRNNDISSCFVSDNKTDKIVFRGSQNRYNFCFERQTNNIRIHDTYYIFFYQFQCWFRHCINLQVTNPKIFTNTHAKMAHLVRVAYILLLKSHLVDSSQLQYVAVLCFKIYNFKNVFITNSNDFRLLKFLKIKFRLGFTLASHDFRVKRGMVG